MRTRTFVVVLMAFLAIVLALVVMHGGGRASHGASASHGLHP